MTYPTLAEDQATARFVAGLAAYSLSLDPDRLVAAERGSLALSCGRQVAMYLAHVTLGISLQRVGIAFGRDKTTVAHACRMVEQRRDRPGYDDWLDRLERLALEAMRVTADA